MEKFNINWKYLFVEGLLLTFLGIIALIYPLMMSLSIEILLGSLLFVAGIVQGVSALQKFKGWNSVPMLIGAGFTLIAGILFLAYPLTGVLTLTILLTAYFFVDGISKIITSFQYRSLQGWGLLLFSGLISFLLGLLIFTGLPTSAVWVIGVYVGIYLLFLGTSFMTLSFYLRKHDFVM